MILLCAGFPDTLVAGRRYPIHFPTPSALLLPLWPQHHPQDLMTPVFNIGESNSEVCFSLQRFHRCENLTGTYPPIFLILPTS